MSRRAAHKMPLVTDMRHKNGLSFAMQRKVVMLRDDKGMSWDGIADPAIGGITNLSRPGLSQPSDVLR